MSSTVDTTGDDSLPPRNTAASSAPVAQAVNPLPKCVCSWKNCRAYQKAFREDKHGVFDGVIRIKLLQGHQESMAYMDCLDRTLDVTKEPEWKDSKNGPEPSPKKNVSVLDHIQKETWTTSTELQKFLR